MCIMLIFSFNDVWRRSSKVGSMLGCLDIGEEKGVVKNRVDSPGMGKLEARIGGGGSKDFEGAMSVQGELGFWMSGFDICAI